MNYKIIDYDIASEHSDFIAPHILETDGKEHYGYICAYTDDDIFTGMAVISSDPGNVQVLSVMVSPEYQRQGVARELLRQGGSMCISAGINSIGCTYATDEESWGPLHDLLTKCDYELLEEYPVYEIKIGEFKDSMIMEREALPLRPDCLKLKDVPRDVLGRFNEYLEDSGIFEPIYRDDYDQEYSLFYIDDGNVIACVLYSDCGNGDMDLSFAYLKKGSMQQDALFYLFMASGQMLYDGKNEDSVLSITALNEHSDKIAKRLLPNLQKKYSLREYERDILHTWG